MADTTTSPSAAPASSPSALASSSTLGTGGLYAANVVAITHWVFACYTARALIEPDETTAVLLAGALMHMGSKLSGWLNRDKGAPRVPVASVAAQLQAALGAAGIPKLVGAMTFALDDIEAIKGAVVRPPGQAAAPQAKAQADANQAQGAQTS